MFQAIAKADPVSLDRLAPVFIKGSRKAAALLALDHLFSRLPTLKSYTADEMSQFLAKFLEYSRLLHSVISDPDPLSHNSIKQLFCIREVSNTEYNLELGTFLHSSAIGDCDGHQHPTVALSKNDVVLALRKYLAARLCERTIEENHLCCNASAFSQCLTFIINDTCNRVNCPQEHVRLADLDPKRYNLRLGIHLRQIHILQVMYSVSQGRRFVCVITSVFAALVTYSRPLSLGALHWLTHLYEAFNPHFHVQGSIADFDLSPIPGAHVAIGVMKHLVRDALYSLQPGQWDKYLTTILKLTSLLFTFDKSVALECIRQAYFVVHRTRIPLFKYPDPDGCYAVEDIVHLFDGTKQTCISSGMKFLRSV